MDPRDLRRAIAWLEGRVRLAAREPVAIEFDEPDVEEMVRAGIPAPLARRVRGAPWWREMVADVVETPGFAGPEESPETVLRYARDVVGEYVRKRFHLAEDPGAGEP